MIDITERGKPKRYEVHRCFQCDHNKYPEGKIIDPTIDKNWHRNSKGEYVCGVCTVEQMINLMGGSPAGE
jgi:hypothetical protein